MIPSVGITERGDAGLDLSWLRRLDQVSFAVLITKRPEARFVQAVAAARKPVIVHVTCTGFGGTVLEPNVPAPGQVRGMVNGLLRVLPPERVVLRVDPIIPTEKGIQAALLAARLFSDTGIKRLRYSFLDLYPHVQERFKKAGLPVPWDGFHSPAVWRKRARQLLRDAWLGDLESCAEGEVDRVGCISAKDYTLVGFPVPAVGVSSQCAACACLATKRELPSNRAQCPHGCLYCYWK